jgi:serine/threonine-protein kinase
MKSRQGKRSHYKLLQELGRGSAGVIHLALDVEDDRLVALKHLSREAVNRHHNAVARFRREVRILSRLRHPNLVDIVRCGHSRGRPYFAMEFVDGQTLNAVIASRPLDLKTSLEIALQLADALKYIHKHGIVHRDFKPINILLDADLTPQLADFGLAHDKSEVDLGLTASGTAVGTLRYCSPEQCAGDSYKVDGRADIYALGVVLSTMITRRFPKSPESMQDLRSRFDKEYRRAMDKLLIPEEVIRLCKKCMRYDADRRYQTAGEVVRELKGLLRLLNRRPRASSSYAA